MKIFSTPNTASVIPTKSVLQRFSRTIAILTCFSFGISHYEAEAKLPLNGFKGVTDCFKENKKYFSPTIGMAALDGGLIENLRFYGNYTPAYKDDKRDYANDSSKDPIWNLVRILFPSTAGQLSGDSRHPNNFGNKINTPEAIAILFNFADAVRSGENVDIPSYINNLVKLLVPVNPDLEKQMALEMELKGKIQGIEIEPETKTNDFKKIIVAKTNELISNILMDTSLKESIKKYIKSKTDPLRIVGKIDDLQLTNMKLKLKGFVEDYFKNTKIFKEQNTIVKRFTEGTLIPLLDAINISIRNEVSAPNSFYPKYTTEQIISAFFCYKFSTREDILYLLKNLNPNLINEVSVASFAPNDTLTKEDLPLIAQKQVLNFDDILALSTADLWATPTPYRVGSTFLSNGSAQKYDRKNNILGIGSNFADCADISIRHLINCFIFNPINRQFDFSGLERYQQENLSPEQQDESSELKKNFQIFKNFYAAQTPDQANNGSVKMRSEWNRVVGDLNAFGGSPETQVRYVQGTNELDTGFINLMKVFHKVLGIKLEQPPHEGSSLLDMKKWIMTSFQNIFKALNPNAGYSIEVNIGDIKYDKEINDIFGTIIITVKDQLGEMLYSSDLYSGQGHAQLSNYNVNQKFKVSMDRDLLGKNISLTGAENALWLLSQNKDVRASKIQQSPFLYQLFKGPFWDNASKIGFLETLGKIDQPQPFLQLNGILANVLDGISWNDQDTLRKIYPSIEILLPVYPEVLKGHVGGYMSKTANNEKVNEIIDLFPNIEYLYLSENRNINHLSLGSLVKLKVLNSYNTNISSIDGLDQLTSLEHLQLSYTPKLRELSLGATPKLKLLDVSNSPISIIKGINQLIGLKRLILTNTNIQELTLNGLTDLEYIELDSSKISRITLDHLMSLESLVLSSTRNLEELIINDLPKLNDLNLNYSAVSTITGLDQLAALKKLHLEETKNLQELSLKGLLNLKSLDLLGSSVSKIYGVTPELIKRFASNADTFKKLQTLGVEDPTDLPQPNSTEKWNFAITCPSAEQITEALSRTDYSQFLFPDEKTGLKFRVQNTGVGKGSYILFDSAFVNEVLTQPFIMCRYGSAKGGSITATADTSHFNLLQSKISKCIGDPNYLSQDYGNFYKEFKSSTNNAEDIVIQCH